MRDAEVDTSIRAPTASALRPSARASSRVPPPGEGNPTSWASINMSHPYIPLTGEGRAQRQRDDGDRRHRLRAPADSLGRRPEQPGLVPGRHDDPGRRLPEPGVAEGPAGIPLRSFTRVGQVVQRQRRPAAAGRGDGGLHGVRAEQSVVEVDVQGDPRRGLRGALRETRRRVSAVVSDAQHLRVPVPEEVEGVPGDAVRVRPRHDVGSASSSGIETSRRAAALGAHPSSSSMSRLATDGSLPLRAMR